MCGIAGIYRRGRRARRGGAGRRTARWSSEMLRSIEYRGPDDEGLESVGRVTLGVRRLAILDVAGGHQPLSDVSGRVWAVQNGELYDFPALRRDLAGRHPLRTHTDTELLPYLWLEQRRGLRALAARDVRAGDPRRLARRADAGARPARGEAALRGGGRGARALRLGAQGAVVRPGAAARAGPRGGGRLPGARVDPGRGHPVPGDPQGAPRLPHPARARCGAQVRQERYRPWPRFFTRPDAATLPVEQLADEAGRLLGDAAAAMLLSDRPVGVLLSGGLDSSVLVAMLPEEVRRETRTFAIGFEDGGLPRRAALRQPRRAAPRHAAPRADGAAGRGGRVAEPGPAARRAARGPGRAARAPRGPRGRGGGDRPALGHGG